MYIVFPTLEVAPFVSGGIGHYISQIIQYLQTSSYTPLLLLYNVSQDEVAKARQHYKVLDLSCEIYHVNQFAQTKLEPEDIYDIEKTSLALAESLKILIAEKNLVGVEWCEHGGVGFHTLRDRHCNPDSLFKNMRMWVHLHGAREIWDLMDRYPVSLDMGNSYVLSNYAERLSLELADAWKSPSQSVANWYTNYFGIQNQVLIPPLPYRKLANRDSHKIDRDYNYPLRILCPGRIVYLKGTDTIARACVEICEKFPGKIHITFAGYNLPTANPEYNSSMDEVMSFIPEKFLSNFLFLGKYSSEEYLKLAQDSDLAIFASRVETFCLAAHEINWIGVPLILSDIPAFENHFQDSINCYKFDQTVEGLIKVLDRILTSPALLPRIRSEPIDDFNPNIFDKLVNLPLASKVNSNYVLFSRMQDMQLTPSRHLHQTDFKYLSAISIKKLFTAIAWKIMKRLASKLSVKPGTRLTIKSILRSISRTQSI